MKTLIFIYNDSDSYGSHSSKRWQNSVRRKLREIGDSMNWDIREGIAGEGNMCVCDENEEQNCQDFVYEMAMTGSTVNQIMRKIKKQNDQK